MTTSPTQGEHAQPEAPYLQLADLLASGQHLVSVERKEAADAIRTLHTQVAALTAAPQGGAYAPMQGLSAYLRAEAVGVQGVAAETLRQWAAEVDVASAHALRASHGQAPAAEALQADLVAECERAMRQREEFLKTGVSTASHGGSHDTCFPAILRKHGVIAPAAGAVAGPSDETRSTWQQGYAQGAASALPSKVTNDMRRVFREGYREGGFWADRLDYALEKMLAAAPTPAAQVEDAALLDWLRDNTCDLRCISVPTGADDADVDWLVIEHYEAKPKEREIARGYSDDPRAAIRAAALAQKEGKV